jgi:2-aminoadipate transaminase
MGSFNDGIDELIITSGAQQVMDLAAKSLCNERDTVICESPSFIGSLNTFRSYNINLCGVSMDNDGINIDLLEKALNTKKNVRFIYVIPNFQNPSGITLSLKKRKAIYELAVKYNVLILEDNPYGDLRFYGENIPNIKSFDKTGHVIYAGTFSKIISPGLRVGFAIAPKDIITKMVVCKQGQDVHTNVLAQLIIDNFLEKCDIKLHLSNLQKLYKEKAIYMEQFMERYFNGNITYNKIEGGLFVWCKIQIGIDIIDFCKAALEKKVCIIPGNTFMVDESEHTNAFRVTYSTPSKEQIEKGVKILGEIAKI